MSSLFDILVMSDFFKTGNWTKFVIYIGVFGPHSFGRGPTNRDFDFLVNSMALHQKHLCIPISSDLHTLVLFLKKNQFRK